MTYRIPGNEKPAVKFFNQECYSFCCPVVKREVITMKKEFLRRIDNPVVRKRFRILLNNGFSLEEDKIREFLSGDLQSDYIQVFPTVSERKVLENMSLDFSGVENLFLLVEGNSGLHWKASEIVKAITERSDASVIWNFRPSNQNDKVLKVTALSY